MLFQDHQGSKAGVRVQGLGQAQSKGTKTQPKLTLTLMIDEELHIQCANDRRTNIPTKDTQEKEQK